MVNTFLSQVKTHFNSKVRFIWQEGNTNLVEAAHCCWCWRDDVIDEEEERVFRPQTDALSDQEIELKQTSHKFEFLNWKTMAILMWDVWISMQISNNIIYIHRETSELLQGNSRAAARILETLWSNEFKLSC